MTGSTTKFRWLLREVDARAATHSNTMELLSVSQYRGVVPRHELTDAEPRAEDLSNYKTCRPGDIVLNRMSAYQGAVGVSSVHGMVSPDYAVLRPVHDVSGHYLAYVMKSAAFVGQMTMRLRGIGAPGTNSVRTPRVNVEDLGDIDVYSPALEEQRSIADFLDDQVARIDRTVEARRRQVQSTTEWLSSLLDEVVWAEPGSLPVKYLVQGITSGPRGWGELVRDEGQPFLRIGNLPSKGIDLRLDDLARVDAPDDAESRRARTRAGDVLLGITASLGDVGLVTPALAGSFISQHVARLRPRHDVDGEWLAWALQTRRVRDSLSVSGYGGTKVGLGLAEVANTHVPLCSAQTRQRVVAEARSVWEAGDRHIGLLARSTELLLELKRSMIGAAVSGEMNVSTAAGAGASV